MTFTVSDAISGATAGVISKTSMAPIERVKLLMQLRGSLRSDLESNGKKTGYFKYNNFIVLKDLGPWDVAKIIYRKEGLLAFWRGNTSGVIRQGGSAALNFMLMDWYKVSVCSILKTLSLILPYNHKTSESSNVSDFLTPFLSGGLAGCTTTTMMYPFDFVRTKLAMDVGLSASLNNTKRNYPGGMRDVIRSLSKNGPEGIRGIYNGYGMALICVFLYRSLLLGGYDVFKIMLTEERSSNLIYHHHSTELSFADRFILAQTVSIFAGIFCYPFDSIRRRMMMQAGRLPNEILYNNSFHAVKKVWIQEGIRGFFLGLGPNLFRSFGGTLLLVTYDYFQIFLDDHTCKKNIMI